MAINPLGDNFTLNPSSSSHSRVSRALRRFFEILCTPIALVMALLSSKDKPVVAVPLDSRRVSFELPPVQTPTEILIEFKQFLRDNGEKTLSQVDQNQYHAIMNMLETIDLGAGFNLRKKFNQDVASLKITKRTCGDILKKVNGYTAPQNNV